MRRQRVGNVKHSRVHAHSALLASICYACVQCEQMLKCVNANMELLHPVDFMCVLTRGYHGNDTSTNSACLFALIVPQSRTELGGGVGENVHLMMVWGAVFHQGIRPRGDWTHGTHPMCYKIQQTHSSTFFISIMLYLIC